MKMAIGAITDAALGFLLGYFGKCSGGTCPLTGNPIVGTIFGAILGLALTAGK